MKDVSVVIGVRSDPLLPKAISSVPKDVELIVAMTSPPQEEVARVKKMASNRDLRIEITDKIGMAVGVNLGARSASYDKVVILDSDCRLLPDTLNAYSDSLSHFPFVRGITLVERDCYWSKIAALGTERLNRVFAQNPRFLGPSIAFRKTEFFRHGGYDEKMRYGSCDHEFALRLEKNQQPVYFDPKAIIIHRPLTFKIDAYSHIGYGRGMYYIDQKHGSHYGLSVCLKRLTPTELYTRAIERGGMSVIRSIIMGTLMLTGYLREFANS